MTATDAAGRIAAFLDALDSVVTNLGFDGEIVALPPTHDAPYLSAADLRVLLAEHAAATARVAALEARLATPTAAQAVAYLVSGRISPTDCVCGCAPGDCGCGFACPRCSPDCPICDRDEADAAPLCAHCGERNPDGTYAEADRSWMCAPCHTAAARGETR